MLINGRTTFKKCNQKNFKITKVKMYERSDQMLTKQNKKTNERFKEA